MAGETIRTPFVSDHAILRYLERVKGVNMDNIRAEMMSPAVHAAVQVGCNTVIMGNGARLRLHGNVVQTVLAKGMKS